jgi:hypothetical protein
VNDQNREEEANEDAYDERQLQKELAHAPDPVLESSLRFPSLHQAPLAQAVESYSDWLSGVKQFREPNAVS